MDDIRIPFTMQAAVAPDGPSPDPFEGRLPPGWVRIPVSLRVALPAEVLDGTAGAAGTPVAIMPHDLRLGGEPWSGDGQTWEDPGVAPGARHDTPFPMDAIPNKGPPAWDGPATSSGLVPPPPVIHLSPNTGRLPAFTDFDAFLAFMDNPEHRPPIPGADVSGTGAPRPAPDEGGPEGAST